MNNFTEIEIIKQWLDSHWTDVLKYYGAKMKNASEVEKINWGTSASEKIVGMLCTYVADGVQKIVNVTPDTFINALSGISSTLAAECRNATIYANQAGDYATSAGQKALEQANRVDSLIAQVTALKLEKLRDDVEAQGQYAERSGDNAQSIYEQVDLWFNGKTGVVGFKNDAETWYNLAEAAELLRVGHENVRISSENVRVQSESDRVTEESARVQREDVRELNEKERKANELLRQSAEGERQTVFEQTQADRQQAFEDAEAERMAAMLLTHFEVDPDTGCLMAYMTENDPTNYFIRNGYMMAEIEI